MPQVPRTLAIIPPGGYVFDDTSTGVSVRIEGGDFEDLAKRVLAHRLANGRPPGEPLREIYDRLCGRHPDFCVDSNSRPLEPTAAVERSFREGASALRVAAWIAEFYRLAAGAPRVPEAIALRRAEICRACPHNVDWREGCGSCIANVERLSFVYKSGKGTPLDNRLYACDVLGQKNDVAIWSDALPPAGRAEASLPAGCWRKAP